MKTKPINPELEKAKQLFKDNAEVMQYLGTYLGSRLFEVYSLTSDRYWLIQGEDKNPDFTGSRDIPTLGVVKGKLSDVLPYAVKMDGFFSWGSGGTISPISVKYV